MSEYIGARITLISKSDIRYSGVLHEINSESSTVALENVKSYGTEGRRGGEDEIPPSDNLYEYIVFRGSDVKDLRIEDAAKETQRPPPPQMPDDPAILGAARPHQAQQQGQNQPPPQSQQQQNYGPPGGPGGQYPPQWGQYPPYGGRGFGPPGGFPGGPGGFGPFPGGYPGMQYGAPPPPGWHPGHQGFPPGPPGPFSPGPMGTASQHGPHGHKGPQVPPIGPPENKAPGHRVAEAEAVPANPAKSKDNATPGPTGGAQKAPPPPVDSKPDVAAALAAPQPAQPQSKPPPSGPKAAPTGPKSGRFVPAVPLASPQPKPATKAAGPAPLTANRENAQPDKTGFAVAAQNAQNATQAATAAVAAAMAKLSSGQPKTGPDNAALDNLQKKVADMRTDDKIRHAGQPGTGGYAAGQRGGRPRGRGRGGSHHAQHAKVEVPQTDFDFESANAKFNKLDLAKEAIASGSPLGEATNHALDNGVDDGELDSTTQEGDMIIPAAASATYNKSSSFFDNISSELRDRQDSVSQKFDGAQFRSEERQKNLETFGQGSVDSYRGGYRGRGRGRGYRGRGGPRGRGRGFSRGGTPQSSTDAGLA